MNSFFTTIERQAYRMAYISCASHDDALDLVQDAMCRFVDKYGEKPKDEWKPLFYRILKNHINDYHRKQIVRNRWMFWRSGQSEEGDNETILDSAIASTKTPEREAQDKQLYQDVEAALQQLSAKQQHIFLLRAWQELSVKETALAMGCSEGTVKTQYFRATTRLKEILGKDWP